MNVLTVTGALSQGFLMKEAVRSRRDMMRGGMIIPGAAMATLEGITCIKAPVAAAVLAPTTSPSSVSMLIPFFTSCWQSERFRNNE